jgi:hypothetical protein
MRQAQTGARLRTQRPYAPRWKPGPQPCATWITSLFDVIGAGVIACAPGITINANAPAAANIANFFISILQLKFCIVAPDAFAPLTHEKRNPQAS